MLRWSAGLVIATALLFAAETVPKFEDFRVTTRWIGPNAAVKLVRPDERMFRTKLSNGAKENPNFAGHYRFVGWGCGSVCAAGAIVDLKTGDVHPPPGKGKGKGWDRWIFAGGFVDGPYVEMRMDSRLLIVRQQSKEPTLQEVSYYEWSGGTFRLLMKQVEAKTH